MDRFKFRVWNKFLKEFSNRNCQLSSEGKISICYMDGCKDDFEDSRNYIVSQCTGLKDKNGKLMYEGDIVIWNDGHGECELNAKEGWIRKAIVKFDPIYNLELTKDTPSGEPFHKFGYWNFIYKDSEKFLKVIGNIYENPELMKETKKGKK